MRRVAACACVQPIVKASVMAFSIGSERKQIGQKVTFFGRRQRRAIDVATVAVADKSGIEAEAFHGLLSRIAGGARPPRRGPARRRPAFAPAAPAGRATSERSRCGGMAR